MALVCLILDSRPPYLGKDASQLSLLTLPLGRGTVIDELLAGVQRLGCGDLRVLPTFSCSTSYESRIREATPPGTAVVGPDAFSALVHEYEPSDHVLIVDPHYWPEGGLDIGSIERASRDARWAVHGVAIAATPEGTRESVHCNEHGQVTRISRYYDPVTCSQIEAIVHSVVPLTPGLAGLRFDSLPSLRSALSARGILSRDEALRAGMIDLSTEGGLLLLNERRALAACSGPVSGVAGASASGLAVGRQCRLHPSSRIVAPVVLQEGVSVEEGAMIVGPAVIGAHSRVRRGSLVAQSVLASGTTALPGAVVRHRVGSGRCATDEREAQRSRHGSSGAAGDRAFEPIRKQMHGLAADSGFRDRHRMHPVLSWMKLALDVATAGVSLALLSPVLALVAAAIKLDSRGPVLFGHVREGKNGRPFRCWKFRTMCEDADQKQRGLYAASNVDGPQFKLEHDPRVTRVGHWLRVSNIDELPQLINVFLGQMSLVGPRPSPFRENQICVPWRHARLSVRPGITGLWQICRDQRSEGDFHQWITYDLMYVRNWSLWLDVKILLATVLTLGGMFGVRSSWLVPATRQGSQATGPGHWAGQGHRAEAASTQGPLAQGTQDPSTPYVSLKGA